MNSKAWLLSWLLMSCACLSAADSSSTVTIDWSALTTGQQACVASSATPSIATLILKHANVILYDYTLNVRSHQLPSNDAGNLPAAAAPPAPGAGVRAPVDCTEYVNAAARLRSDPGLFPEAGREVSLEDSQAALANRASDIGTILDEDGSRCSFADRRQAQVPDAVRRYKWKADHLPGDINFQYQIDNQHWQDFTLQERLYYNGKVSTELKWKCGLEDILTLSVGTLLTTLPYRTYDHQAVPTATGTQDTLVVNGNSSLSPQGLALLNYKLFVADWGFQPGLALSTGPAFKFGGTPQVSNFGWFAGISASVWRRFFISAGMHLGQFADFPPGFRNGSPIPANFGTLTPTTRWSGRFAVGLTFQTNSFVKSDQSGPTSTPKSAKKSP